MDAGSRIRPVEEHLAGVRPEILARREALLAFRRDLHRHPEFGAGCEFRFFSVCPATINDGETAAFVAEVAADTRGRDNVVGDLGMMGADDMSDFLRERPGCELFLRIAGRYFARFPSTPGRRGGAR
jgi:metal-dependent amidase/aminoacylase/carboxypeptidase family protein